MIAFLQKIKSFILFYILYFMVFLVGYVIFFGITSDDIPAPELSTSYSLNEKLRFLRKAPENVEILSLGSSMNLNNLNSESIVHTLQTEAYLNTASWGMSMDENYKMLQIFDEIYKPEILIISSNIMDFGSRGKNIKYNQITDYLKSENTFKFHLINLRIQYYLDNFKYAKKVRNDINEHGYLGFDKYGAVDNKGENFKIKAKLWNHDILNQVIDSVQYKYLDSIAVFCKNRGTKLWFFNAPIREQMMLNYDDEKLTKYENHRTEVNRILTKSNQVFIDANNILWNDSLFIDSNHFNRKGAKLYTEYCLEQLKSIEVQ